ncbi:MAG: transposase [Pseudorhodoplanes sp.]
MTKTQVEVITSVERRRRWSRAEKEQLVAASIEPGAVASEVARAAGVATSQLFRWRRQLCGPGPASPFSAVAVVPGPDAPGSAPPANGGTIEVEFTARARRRHRCSRDDCDRVNQPLATRSDT